MSWWTTLFGWLGGSSTTAAKVTDIVDEAVHTTQEKAEDATADLAAARAYTPGEKWDTLVDKWHRAIRPAVATWAVAILFGAITPPDHWGSIPAEVWAVILMVITFYFGGRGFLQDLRTRILPK